MPKPKRTRDEDEEEERDQLPDPVCLPTPALNSSPLRMSYRIARGEQGVLTFEPYKSILLPYWRFRTVSIARRSSTQLAAAFDAYVRRGDFVGADMARKFIQMGMTRARRYGNYKGGRKYDRVKGEDGGVGEKVLRDKSAGHEGKEEKDRASEIFKEVWRRCLADEGYGELKKVFLNEQREWDRRERAERKSEAKEELKEKVKQEEEDG